MKIKTESVKTLFLVLLLQAVVWATNVGLPNSRSLTDVLEAHGKYAVEHSQVVDMYLERSNGAFLVARTWLSVKCLTVIYST